MTLEANGVTWLRRTVLPQGSQGPDGACPPAPPHRPELRAATARSVFWDDPINLLYSQKAHSLRNSLLSLQCVFDIWALIYTTRLYKRAGPYCN